MTQPASAPPSEPPSDRASGPPLSTLPPLEPLSPPPSVPDPLLLEELASEPLSPELLPLDELLVSAVLASVGPASPELEPLDEPPSLRPPSLEPPSLTPLLPEDPEPDDDPLPELLPLEDPLELPPLDVLEPLEEPLVVASLPASSPPVAGLLDDPPQPGPTTSAADTQARSEREPRLSEVCFMRMTNGSVPLCGVPGNPRGGQVLVPGGKSSHCRSGASSRMAPRADTICGPTVRI